MSPPAEPCPLVLVVDDNLLVLRFVTLLFSRHGAEIIAASTALRAVEEFHRHGRRIAAVIADVQMPGQDGPALLTALRARDPDVKCWFMSGNTGSYSLQDLLNRGAVGLLHKPFRENELAAVLDAIGVAGHPLTEAPT